MVKDMVNVIISGYGKMGHIVENELKAKGIELVLATDDICSVPKEKASECVCIDFTTPAAFRENYRFIAENFKAAVVGTTHDTAGNDGSSGSTHCAGHGIGCCCGYNRMERH